MKTVSLAFAALLLAGTTAIAADLGSYEPVPMAPAVPAGPDWSGWWLGGYAGGIFGGEFTGDAGGPGLNSVDAGVDLHRNYVLDGGLILAPFISATIPVQRGEVLGVDVQVNWAVSGGVRLGFAHDRWLPYVFAGGMVAQATASSSFGTNVHTGFIAGGGIDYAVSDRWSLGARYTYYGLGERNYSGASAGWHGQSVVGTISFKLH